MTVHILYMAEFVKDLTILGIGKSAVPYGMWAPLEFELYPKTLFSIFSFLYPSKCWYYGTHRLEIAVTQSNHLEDF